MALRVLKFLLPFPSEVNTNACFVYQYYILKETCLPSTNKRTIFPGLSNSTTVRVGLKFPTEKTVSPSAKGRPLEFPGQLSQP